MEIESSVDRISDLPDGVLCHILSFLPTEVAVLTSILSTRWRYLYTLVSSLYFETGFWDGYDEEIDAEKPNQFMNFIDRVLFFRNRPSIVTFRLACYQYVDPLRVDAWMRALMWHNIQELDLSNYDDGFRGLPLPASLFSCETLVVLRLKLNLYDHDLKVPTRICLPNLKLLEIFEISNPSLRRLTMKHLRAACLGKTFQIMINAPSLIYLNYCFHGDHSLAFVDMQSLVDAVFDCETRDVGDYQHIIADVFTGIKNIQSLLMSNDLAGQHNVSIPLLDKVTLLKILDWDFYFDFDCLQYLLAHFVVLKSFVLTGSISKGHPTINCSLQQSPPTFLLFHLKAIEIWSHRMEEVEAYMKIVTFPCLNSLKSHPLS
ncbi:hypothetical protein SLEP1_g26445 [Rubroshorea leprosula]|uniref:F-box domain-containing protein n=1 Tax=Rubroshorea leprosula TaxID=152421 RepID=A0AAV5JU53_9ROSI|nr:hypothetical protein SLEP1_g26445 [Rubroshorea leprosula]